MRWIHEQTHLPYVDFSRELVSFPDGGSTSVDIRLTFNVDDKNAYCVVCRCNDDGDTRLLAVGEDEMDNEIQLTWKQGMDMLVANWDFSKSLPDVLYSK